MRADKIVVLSWMLAAVFQTACAGTTVRATGDAAPTPEAGSGAGGAGSPGAGGSHTANDAATEEGAVDAAAAGKGGESPDGSARCENLPGPSMVEIGLSSGRSYCIDATEVTQAHYLEFLKGSSVEPGAEHQNCASNESFEPLPMIDAPSPFQPAAHPDWPMYGIDWCDAFAYCAWAGKRLCGEIGGGALDFHAADDPLTSQWLYACTQGNTTAYGYGTSFDLDACTFGGNGVYDRSGCHGGVAPFDRVFNMSDPLPEYEDACSYVSGDNCRVHAITAGADYDNPCAWAGITDRVSVSQTGMSFRCCVD